MYRGTVDKNDLQLVVVRCESRDINTTLPEKGLVYCCVTTLPRLLLVNRNRDLLRFVDGYG